MNEQPDAPPAPSVDAPAPGATTSTDTEEPDPRSLCLVAEISALLRSPPLPPRATLERVKALLTAARAVAAVDPLDREALLDESAAATGLPRSSVELSRAETIRAAQLNREQNPISLGSRLALSKPKPTNDLNVKILNEKRSGILRSEDSDRDFRF